MLAKATNYSPIKIEKNQTTYSDDVEQAENTEMLYKNLTYPLKTLKACMCSSQEINVGLH